MRLSKKMSMKEFLFDRTFYKGVLTLGLPIAAQNLLSSSASLIDTVMVGQLGEVPLSAVGMAGQWSFFMFLFYFGFSSGSSVFFSQYWGVKDMSRIRHTYSLGFLNVFIIAVLFMTIGYLFPETVIRVFTTDEAVVLEGAKYLKIAVFGYIVYHLLVVVLVAFFGFGFGLFRLCLGLAACVTPCYDAYHRSAE